MSDRVLETAMRLEQLGSLDPATLRLHALSNLRKATGADVTLFIRYTITDGVICYSDVVCQSDSPIRQALANLSGKPVLGGDVTTSNSTFIGARRDDWSVHHGSQPHRNTFSSLLQDYDSLQPLKNSQIWREIYEPWNVRDQVRALVYDGDVLVGWFGALRLNPNPPFSSQLVRSLNKVMPLYKAVLLGANTLESSWYSNTPLSLVMSKSGQLYSASRGAQLWLHNNRPAMLAALAQAVSAGTCHRTFLVGHAEVRMTTLMGEDGLRYLANISPAPPLLLDADYHLSPRQRQVALRASEGQSLGKIAEHMSISPDTVKHCLREIYTLLGVNSRMELRDRLTGIA